MRKYQQPEVVCVKIDSDISMIMMSFPYNYNTSTNGYSSHKMGGSQTLKKSRTDNFNSNAFEIGDYDSPFAKMQ